MKSRQRTEKVLKAHRFQLKFVGTLSISSKNCAGGLVMMGKAVMRWRSNMISTNIFIHPLASPGQCCPSPHFPRSSSLPRPW